MPRKKKPVTDTTNAPVRKTKEERIAAAQVSLAKAEAKVAWHIANIARLQSEGDEANIIKPEVGDVVDFTYGRTGSPEGVRTLTGTVTVVAEDDYGYLSAGILSGEGFDQKVLKVRLKNITVNRTADAREAENPTVAAVETDPLAVV